MEGLRLKSLISFGCEGFWKGLGLKSVIFSRFWKIFGRLEAENSVSHGCWKDFGRLKAEVFDFLWFGKDLEGLRLICLVF